MVICLERGADLHMAQLMPLPLTVSWFSKIQIVCTFLVPAHPGSPGQGPLNGFVVCLSIYPAHIWQTCCNGSTCMQLPRTCHPSHTASAHNQARTDVGPQSHHVHDRLLQLGALRSSDDYHQQAAARPEQCSEDCAADAKTNSCEASTQETALIARRKAHQIQDSRAQFQGSEHVDAGISQPPHPDVSIYSQMYIQLIYCDLPLAPLKLRPKALYKCNYYYCCYYC